MLADMFTYLMLLLNLTVVCLVVLKTVLDNEQCAEEAIAHALDDIQLSAETGAGVYDAQDALGVTLVVLPIVSGVLMTFHNAFNVSLSCCADTVPTKRIATTCNLTSECPMYSQFRSTTLCGGRLRAASPRFTLIGAVLGIILL